MKHIVYKITNSINNKVYVGKHSTNEINDGYMGSSKILNRAIKKYGKDNFKKDILFIFDNEKESYEMESSIVDKDFINSDNTYNLTEGGFGGWDGKVPCEDKSGNIIMIDPNSNQYNEVIPICRIVNKGTIVVRDTNSGELHKVSKDDERYQSGEMIFFWNGKKHTEETKQKIRQASTGKKHTKEAKEKMSKANKNKIMVIDKDGNITKVYRDNKKYLSGDLKIYSICGDHLSKEHKKKISKTLTGRKMAEETKLKISKTLTGRKFTEEHKAKIAESNRKRKKEVGYEKK